MKSLKIFLIISTVTLFLPLPIIAQSHTHTISTTWNNVQLPPNATITISFSLARDPLGHESLLFQIQAPHYNDPLPPTSPPEEPLPGLWDYEVVELFFLGEDDEYLEIEVSPSSHYILLYLKGYRNDTEMYLPLQFVNAEVNSTTQTWTGEAYIPANYFPCNVSKFNAYAIHGSDEKRQYLSLFPITNGEIDGPDFHYLDAFQPVDLGQEVNPLCRSYDYMINTTWDGQESEGEFFLSFSIVEEEMLIEINAPFFNDPLPPEGPTNEPFPGLWEYEVVELFFLGNGNEYLEIELAPSGHYLLLYLIGYRNDTGRVLPIDQFIAKVVNTTEDKTKQRWIGEAKIPGGYFPCNITKFNAYAIFKSDLERSYNSLFPVFDGELNAPDFHYLEGFGQVGFDEEVNAECGKDGSTTTPEPENSPTTTPEPDNSSTTGDNTGGAKAERSGPIWLGILVAVYIMKY